MNPSLRVSLAALALAAAFPVSGQASSAGTTAVESMGRLNGIALACGQPALSARARDAVIAYGSRDRSTGEAFEAATNATYLSQGAGGAPPCPDARRLAEQIGAVEASLRNRQPEAR